MENKANLMISLAIFSSNIPGETQLQLHNMTVKGGCTQSGGEAVRMHEFC